MQLGLTLAHEKQSKEGNDLLLIQVRRKQIIVACISHGVDRRGSRICVKSTQNCHPLRPLAICGWCSMC